MESFSLDVSGREQGILLQNKTFVPPLGPLFSVCNTIHGRKVNFVHAAWNSHATKLLAGDCLGNVYLFYLSKNKFRVIRRLRGCVSLVSFTPDPQNDVLVALADTTIHSLSSSSGVGSRRFSGHSSSVVSLCVQNGVVLSCCRDRAILWNLSNMQVQRALALKKDVDIIQVCFAAGSSLVSGFSDGSLFLWDSRTFDCQSHWVCSSEGKALPLRTMDVSGDGSLVACGGRAEWFVIWSIPLKKRLHTMRVPAASSIKLIKFTAQNNRVCVVNGERGDVQLLNLDSLEVEWEVTGCHVTCCLPSPAHSSQLATLSLKEGKMNIYDVEPPPPKEIDNRSPAACFDFTIVKTFQKKKKKQAPQKLFVDKNQLLTILEKFGEYPENHRSYIWSVLLNLPHNVPAFRSLYEDSLTSPPCVKDCPFIEPGLMRTFSKLLSMCVCWHPLLRDLEFFQSALFPFVKIFHKNAIFCFELCLTYISNWCQGWLAFPPFPPFHVLCAVESLIAHHDPTLMAHLSKHHIEPQVFAWLLLKTSFSEVMSKIEFLRLWDRIFSEPPSFLLHVVAAYSTLNRQHILAEHKNIKSCYRRRMSASSLIKEARSLRDATPTHLDPGHVTGNFHPLTAGTATYPTFHQMARLHFDLQTHTRKKLLDQEIDFLKQREQSLEVKETYLKELQDLQLQRRDLLMQISSIKDTSALAVLEKKLQSLQHCIQDNLSNQTYLLKWTIGADLLSTDDPENESSGFNFSSYVRKLKEAHT